MVAAIEMKVKDGQVKAYLAKPEGGQDAPGVVLAPAIAGVNEYVLQTADRLAAAGYATLLVDYYAREGAAPDISSPQKIGEAVAALSDPRSLSDIAYAADHLRAESGVNADRIGSFGFCIGGMYAYLAGCEGIGLKACVDYYGAIQYSETSETKPASPLDRAGELDAPLLCHFGDFDRLISASDRDAFAAALQENQKPYEMFVYHGAPHAFDEDFRAPVYRPAASADAWRRSLAFLDWNLKNRSVR
ncbi:MAG: dienelactone hydrolase family protein [Pseudomonadota bacterium]